MKKINMEQQGQSFWISVYYSFRLPLELKTVYFALSNSTSTGNIYFVHYDHSLDFENFNAMTIIFEPGCILRIILMVTISYHFCFYKFVTLF